MQNVYGMKNLYFFIEEHVRCNSWRKYIFVNLGSFFEEHFKPFLEEKKFYVTCAESHLQEETAWIVTEISMTLCVKNSNSAKTYDHNWEISMPPLQNSIRRETQSDSASEKKAWIK